MKKDNTKKTENLLNAIYRALAYVSEGLVLTDEDGSVLWANTSFSRLIHRDMIILRGSKLIDIFPLEEASQTVPENLHPLSKCLNSDSAVHGEYDYQQCDVKHTLQIWAQCFPTKEGENLAILVIKDLTASQSKDKQLERTHMELEAHEALLNLAMEDYKRTNENLLEMQSQLHQADKLATVGLLTAGIIHEVNNPLTFVGGNLTILQAKLKIIFDYLKLVGSLEEDIFKHNPNPGSQNALKAVKEFGDRVVNEASLESLERLIASSLDGVERMAGIIRDLKTFARPSKDEFIEENINKILDGVIAIVGSELKNRIKLIKEYSEIPPVSCKSQQLGQVFLNLLVNASDAIEDKGTIFLKTYNDEENVYIQIRDSGCGISEEAKEKMFQPFFTTKALGKGTGLGLSISSDIIKSHQGSITVESVIGEGTTFTISLPVA